MGDRRDRIVNAVAVRCGYSAYRVGILSPFFEYPFGKSGEPRSVGRFEPDNRKRPFEHAAANAAVTRDYKIVYRLCAIHREDIAPALIMLMREYAAADNRKICVRADEIMRKHIDKIKHFREGGRIDLHWTVFFAEDYTVLGIVGIRRILQTPLLTAELEWNYPKILARRPVMISAKALVLNTEHASGIIRRSLRGRRYVTRVLFGLGQVYGYVHRTVFRCGRPAKIACYTVGADIIYIAAEIVKPVGRDSRSDA